MNIRPSSLPKLAACPCYESVPGESSPAAQRGTRLDEVFRSVMQGNELPALEVEDANAMIWATDVLKDLAGDCHVITTDELCKVTLPNGMTGTCDAIVPGKWFHADLKSGLVRNYREQMAAYALGLMEQYFVDSWTAHLLFCDAKKVVSFEFTYAEAKALVDGIVATVSNPEKKPSVCEYCNWCAKVETCAPRMIALDSSLATTESSFAAILADPVRLGDFLAKCKVFEKFWDSAKEKARETLETGGEVPGWKLQKGRTSKFISVETQIQFIEYSAISTQKLLRAHGAMSERKFRELWPKDLPFPEQAVETKTASQSLVQI